MWNRGFEHSIGGGLPVRAPGPLLRAPAAAGSTVDQVPPHPTSLPMPRGCGLVLLGQVSLTLVCIA